MELNRRTLIGSMIGVAVCCSGGVVPWSALEATLPLKPTTVRFDAYRGKSKIGVHNVSVVADGTGLKVTTKINMDVSLGFIKLFEFKHDAIERWEDGRLVSIESSTNDDGDKIKVSGAATPDGFRVVGPSGPAIAPVGDADFEQPMESGLRQSASRHQRSAWRRDGHFRASARHRPREGGRS